MSDDVVSQFVDAVRSAGLEFVGPLVADGRLHRVDVAGRRKNAKHGWYVIHPDDPPSGAFGDYKTGYQDTWSAKKPTAMTPAERAALKKRMEETRLQREADRKRAVELAAAAAEKIWAAGKPADPNHGYLKAKGVPPLGVRQLADAVEYECASEDKPKRVARAGSLIVPMRGADGKLKGVQLIGADGKKLFLFGSEKAGSYTNIGKLTDTLIVCEGYATANTVHRATGSCTVVAFDAGNLEPVARAIRAKYPTHRIVVAADNDRFTKGNPGLTRAQEAAEAVGGSVVHPDFSDDDDKSTDFNDLEATAGLEAVQAVFAPPPVVEDEPPPHQDIPDGPHHDGPAQDEPPHEPADYGPDETTFADGVTDPVPLGYDRGSYFYLSAATKQIVRLPASGHVKLGLMQLAPLSYWEMTFVNKKGVDWDEAANSLMRACEQRGVFDPDRIVGRGVTLDRGRVVLHLGDKLIVDGKVNGGSTPSLVVRESDFIYERLKKIRLASGRPLDDDQAREFLSALDLLPWYTSDMAALLAGWVVIAPICGTLRWRPHVWLTGAAGSGKSWVVKNVVERLLGSLALNVQGNTSEASIRHEMGCDARPVIFDEAESQNDRARERLQLILDLARQASSENSAPILKGAPNGGVTRYRIRSCFLFTSINFGATQSADQSRTIPLALVGGNPDDDEDRKAERAQQFAYIEKRFTQVLTDDFGSRLFARTLKQVHTIRENATTFAAAAAERTGSRRLADTICAPLAGWWSLQSSERITMERAREILAKHKWVFDAANRAEAEADHDQALAHLMEYVARESPSQEAPISDLVMRASVWLPTNHAESADTRAADTLRHLGLRVKPGGERGGSGQLLFAQGHARLNEVFAKTPWASSWASVIAQHPKVSKVGPQRFGHIVKKAIAIRIEDLFGGE